MVCFFYHELINILKKRCYKQGNMKDVLVFLRTNHLKVGRQTGFEPATPGTTNQCSNQLSYYRHKRFVI